MQNGSSTPPERTRRDMLFDRSPNLNILMLCENYFSEAYDISYMLYRHFYFLCYKLHNNMAEIAASIILSFHPSTV